MPPEKTKKKKLKVALFHFFLKKDGKGGAEKMFLDIKERFGYDFWTGGIDMDGWGKQNAEQNDAFAKRLWGSKGKIFYLHEESKVPVWRLLKRQFNFLLNPKVKQLNNYDVVIFNFTGIFFVPQRIKKSVYQIGYCNTPPRIFTDQLKTLKSKHSPLLRPLIDLFAKIVIYFWAASFRRVDFKIANSVNVQNRILKHTGIKVDTVLWPPVDTRKFNFLGQGDYYLSYARLEETKRIPLIIEAFKKMPDKKLIVCSSGPLASWLQEKIAKENLQNITYEGIVSDARLQDLVGNCIAGVYLPVNEDSGMTQCEIMAAGKPVIGVNEGGLIESVEDGKHGILIPSEPTTEDLINAVESMTPKKALSLKKTCQEQGKKFDKEIFLAKLDELVQNRQTS